MAMVATWMAKAQPIRPMRMKNCTWRERLAAGLGPGSRSRGPAAAKDRSGPATPSGRSADIWRCTLGGEGPRLERAQALLRPLQGGLRRAGAGEPFLERAG